jgi:type V secretory pathway adhesin AidA
MTIIVNGRKRFFDHLTGFKQTSSYEFTVCRGNTNYEIYGGKHAGGRSNEWYVSTSEWKTPIYTKSLMDSLRLIDTM